MSIDHVGKRTIMSMGVCIAFGAALAESQPALRGVQVPPTIAECRHDQRSTAEDRTRRTQALALAKAINAAQARVVRQTRRYQPLANLGSLPEVPRGFRLNLYADGEGYIFALKDTLDSCRFAVFSDSAGLLYEKSAIAAPVIAR
jgi:hypothetical protein